MQPQTRIVPKVLARVSRLYWTIPPPKPDSPKGLGGALSYLQGLAYVPICTHPSTIPGLSLSVRTHTQSLNWTTPFLFGLTFFLLLNSPAGIIQSFLQIQNWKIFTYGEFRVRKEDQNLTVLIQDLETHQILVQSPTTQIKTYFWDFEKLLLCSIHLRTWNSISYNLVDMQ